MITVPGVPASRKTPGVYLNVVLGGTGTSSGEAPNSIMLMGNKITTTLTGASPSFSVTAGTQPDATPVLIASADDAGTLFGRGSELHRMAIKVFQQWPSALLYGISIAEAGTAASGTLTFATTASAAFSVRCRIGGETFDVSVASGDTATAIAAAVADAINDLDTLPLTAQNSSGVITLTAKCTGLRGNWIQVSFAFVNSANVETIITTSSTTSPGATTGTLSSVTTESSAYLLSSGATQDSNVNALAAMASTKYSRIVSAPFDTTNLTRLVTHINALAVATEQKLQQGIACTADTFANAVALATAKNAARLQIGWHYVSPLPPPDVAASMAAARLAGDTIAGGLLPGENDDPAAVLDGVNLVGIQPQLAVADQPTGSEIEAALNSGLTVLHPSGVNPGGVAITRSITSRFLVSGVPNYSVLDTSVVTVLDSVADDLREALGVAYAGCKLGVDQANGRPPSAPNVITPSIVRDFIAAQLMSYEQAGRIINVQARLPELVVEAMVGVPGRLNANVPVEPIPGAHILAGNVRQVG